MCEPTSNIFGLHQMARHYFSAEKVNSTNGTPSIFELYYEGLCSICDRNIVANKLEYSLCKNEEN